MFAVPTWTKFSEASKADLDAIEAEESQSAGLIPKRLLEYLHGIEGVKMDTMPLGAVDHCRQTATRAFRDGRDEEYVVCALLHDIGEALATFNHGDFAAALLKPYVSAENHWMVKHHPLFQGHYFFEHLGLDPDARDRYRDHPCYRRTVEFCALYDQVAFDPSYDSLPLDFFAPMVERVLARPAAAGDGLGPLALQETMAG